MKALDTRKESVIGNEEPHGLLLTANKRLKSWPCLPKTIDRLISKGCFKVTRIGARGVRIPYSELVKFAKGDHPNVFI